MVLEGSLILCSDGKMLKNGCFMRARMLRVFLKKKSQICYLVCDSEGTIVVFVDLFIDEIKLTRGPTRLKVRLPRMRAQDGHKL